MKIKSNIIKLGILFTILFLSACEKDFLERSKKIRLTYEDIIRADNLESYGMDAYKYLRQWTTLGSNATLASACDEADFAEKGSAVQRFNTGGWNQFTNPDEVISWYYRGIVQTHEFLKNSENYKAILVNDTFAVTPKINYLRDCDEMFKLRAENHFLRAWFYFELVKRYGGVPILTQPLDLNTTALPPRNTFDECIEYIISEIDTAYTDLVDSWVNYDIPNGAASVIGSGKGGVAGSSDVLKLGRVEKVAAKALKLRVLLYAASPLFNNGAYDVDKCKAAAAAGQDFLTDPTLAPWRFLWTSYAGLFNMSDQALLTSRSGKNSGIIFTTPWTAAYNTTVFERWNYPIGIPNGGTSITAPSQNLVDAYEMKATGMLPFNSDGTVNVASGYNPAKPYTGRDPRLGFTIAANGDVYGKSVGGANYVIKSYVGGQDAIGVKQGATTTGYHLKKMARTDFDLSTNPTTIKSFILLRYAEVLLNFAEAMNEGYGPEDKPTIGGAIAAYSALEAVNLVRARADVAMPAIPVGANNQAQLRDKIRNERRVELAFEDHRFFDVRRWEIAEVTENLPLRGMNVTPNDLVAPIDTFTYTPFPVEDRIFDGAKMYLYPIPEAQVTINGWEQNPGW